MYPVKRRYYCYLEIIWLPYAKRKIEMKFLRLKIAEEKGMLHYEGLKVSILLEPLYPLADRNYSEIVPTILMELRTYVR